MRWRTRQNPESLDSLLRRHRRQRTYQPADYDTLSAVVETPLTAREVQNMVIALEGENARLQAAAETACAALEHGIGGVFIARGVLRDVLGRTP